jgi:quinol-cytochrome oxidoreductase complex cytochrome b subunit
MELGRATNVGTRLILGAALSFSAALKFQALIQGTVPTWRVLGSPVAWMWAALVMEFMGASAILSCYWEWGAKAIVVTSVVFAIVLTVLNALGVAPEQCGCFGRLAVPLWLHIAYLLGLFCLAMALALPERALANSTRAR